MAVRIGPQIGIDGEKQYRQEINSIIQQGKTLKAQMDSVASAYANADDKEAALTKVSKALSDQINNQRALVDRMRDAVEKATAKTGANSDITTEWREKLYKAETELHRLEGQTAESAAGVEEFSKAEDESTKKTRIFGDVLKANLLSDAIKSGIKFLADGAKKLGKEIAGAATSAAAYADEINTLAVTSGIATDTLQEYRYAAGLLDVELSTITGAHTKLTRSMASAEKGTGAQAEAFAQLGVEIRDTNGQLRDNGEVFDEVIGRLGAIENETERDAVAMQLFGKSAQELNPLIAAGADQLEAYRKEAHDVGAVLDTETLGTLNRAQDQFDRMGKAAEALKNRIGANIFREFNDELEEATSIMQDFASGKASADEIEKRLDKLFDRIFEKIEKAGGKAAPYVGKAFTKIFDFAVKNFPKLADKLLTKLPDVIEKIGKGAEKTIPKVISTIAILIGKTLAKTPELLKAGFELAKSIGKGIIQGFKDIDSAVAYDLLSDTAKEAIDTAQRIKDEVASIPPALSAVSSSIGEVDAKQREAQRWLGIFDELTQKTTLTKDEQEKLNTAVEKLNDLFPELGLTLDEETGKWSSNTDEIRNNIAALSDRARAEAYYKAASEALEKQVQLEQELTAAQEARAPLDAKAEQYTRRVEALEPILANLKAAYLEVGQGEKSVTDALEGLDEKTRQYLKSQGIEINNGKDLYNASEKVTKILLDYKNGLASTEAQMTAYDDTIAAATQGIAEYERQITYFFNKGDSWERQAQSIGTDLIKGVNKGIVQERANAYRTAADTITGVISAMKRSAMIKSPSKLTENLIGKNLGLGVIKGWDDVFTPANTRRAFNMQAIVEDMKTGGQMITNNNQSATTNLGGVAINVYASPNHDASSIARQVMAEMTNLYNSKKAVFA